MLPYIGAQLQKDKRKTTFAGSEQFVKQWSEIKKQLQARAKLSTGKITTPLLNDFNKICKLKQIPQFYCQYLYIHIEKLNEKDAGDVLSAQIKQIINHRSHYHKISDALDQRVTILKNIENKIEICQGFQDMNSGKSIKSLVKNKINDILKQATSLQDIKQLQNKSIAQLAQQIIKLRKNTMQYVGYVKIWKQSLSSITDRKIRVKIIFPLYGFNCLVLPLFDQGFIFHSFLGKQFVIKQQNNPFILFTKQGKKRSQFQSVFKSQIAKDFINYQIKTSQILAELPAKQELNKKQKQIEQRSKQKQDKTKKWDQINYKSNQQTIERQKSKTNKQGQQKKISYPTILKNKKQIDIDRILQKYKSARTKKQEKQDSIASDQDAVNSKIQQIMNQKALLQKQLKQAKNKNKDFQKVIKKMQVKHEKQITKIAQINNSKISMSPKKNVQDSKISSKSKVEAVYKSIKKKLQKNKSTQEQPSIQVFLSDKKSLQKQIRQEKINKISLQKKDKAQNTNRSINKIQAIYKSQNKQSPNKRQKNLQNSQISIDDIKNENKTLQKQLKQQMREKKGLQKLILKSQKNNHAQIQTSRTEKQKLQLKIRQLQSKLSDYDSPKNKMNENDGSLQRSRASIQSIYLNEQTKQQMESPTANLYSSRLTQQRTQRMSLQKQMKDLLKQKNKLEQIIEKSQKLMTKQKQILDKKMQKYQQTIQKLKAQKDQQKNNKDLPQGIASRKKSESLRMYTATAIKQDEAKLSKKQSSHIQSANYFKLPPEIKRSYIKSNLIAQKDYQQNEKKQLKISKISNKVQIIQTKRTIEIIYQGSSGRSRRSSQNVQKALNRKQSLDNQQLTKIIKQKKNLQFQVQKQQRKKQFEKKIREKKDRRDEKQIYKYRQIIQKQKDKKYELEGKIRVLQTQLYKQFEQKLKAEKKKFQNQKKQLKAMIQNQKNEKELKQKYLNNQVKFLKTMENNEKQLLSLLDVQKRNRLEKQKQLQTQIAKKQELLQIIEIQQIKKGLQSQIRKQIQKVYNQQSQQQINIEQKKDQLRVQIQKLNDEKQYELEQIDEQNQKLKNLIARIKQEQVKIISTIKQNINQQNSQQMQYQYHALPTQQKQELSKAMLSAQLRKNNIEIRKQYHSDAQQILKNESKISQRPKTAYKDDHVQFNVHQTQKIFQSRLKAQQQHENNMSRSFLKIKNSPEYKQKQEVQNLIQMYLQNPHKYPTSKNREYSNDEKAQIKQQVLQKNREASQFQRQLLKLNQVQKFVPTAQDDIMTSHLLNLRRAYQQQQSSALKQQLFPTIIHDETPSQRQLSFDSAETPLPITIKQHVQVHSKKYPLKKNNSKNFLAINKIKLAMQQEDRKQKQKKFIDEQSKKKAHQQALKIHLRARQQQRKRKSLQKKRKSKQKQFSSNKTSKNGEKITTPKKQVVESQHLKLLFQKKSSLISTQVKKEQPNKHKQTDENKQTNIQQQNKKRVQTLSDFEFIDNNMAQQKDEKLEKQDEQIDKSKNNQNQFQKQKQKQNIQKEEDIDSKYIDITNNHSSLDRQKKQLQSDVYRYQEQIRSYVSREDKYDIYQQFMDSSQIQGYIKNLHSMSNQQTLGLNSNNTIFKDIPTYKSIIILVAKDKVKQVQIGIAIFHKQYQDSLYVCDYIIAHNMKNFLNLVFNFSRYIFKLDVYTNKIQYFFNLNKLQDQISIINFIEFQEKCKRMGQVYVKVGSDKTRKYALRRNLFEPADKQFQKQSQGLQLNVQLQVHSDLIKQKGYGFENNKIIQYFSYTALLSFYLKKNEQLLQIFRKASQDDLKYRQLLLTALMLQKKQIDVKNCQTRQYSIQQRLQNCKKLRDVFTIQDSTHAIQQLQLSINTALHEKTKRCTFNIQNQQTNYIIHFPEQAVTKIQCSNSSQPGYFLNLIPKYKVFIVEANQFISMNKVNPQINVFFYIKHLIKNVVDIQKEQHYKVFIPEVEIKSEVFLKDLSEKMKQGIFVRQNVKIGWNSVFCNSIQFNPTHKDLVIKKPFIISVLSAAIERAIEGTPLIATLIQ